MSLPMEASICSSILSLSGDMPLPTSEYLEKIDIPNGSSALPPPRSVVVLKEPQGASSESDAPDTTSRQSSATALANKMRKLWAKIRSMTIESAGGSAIDAAKRDAALQFKANLQAIDDAHGLQRFCFDVQIPRTAFQPEHFNSLDDALDDAMAASLIVEGGDEDKGLQDDIIKISLEIRKTPDGTEVNYIVVEDLEAELNQEYLDTI